jgi:catechol 2,3-dioxygenase-like lactoylglutathione lyase family enzyme
MKKLLAGVVLALAVTSAQAAIPGMRGTDHIGVTVPNLKQAVTFFVEVMGCEAFYQLGPFADDQGSWMTENLNVHARAKIDSMQLVRCANGSNLELFEYQAPEQVKQQPKNSDIGGHHLGFYVDDMDKALAYLKANNIQVLGEPKVMTQGPSAGESWVYFLTPWGMQLELVSYPGGKAYEKSSATKLFSPKG